MDIIVKAENVFFLLSLRCASFFSSLLRRTRYVHVIRCFSRLKSERIIINALERSEESEDEEGASDKIEDPIEDHLMGYRDNVATL